MRGDERGFTYRHSEPKPKNQYEEDRIIKKSQTGNLLIGEIHKTKSCQWIFLADSRGWMWKTMASIGLLILQMVIKRSSNSLALNTAFSGLVDVMEKESLASVKLRDDYRAQLKALKDGNGKKDSKLH